MNSLRTIARRAYSTVHPGGRPGVSNIMRLSQRHRHIGTDIWIVDY